jgi:hypothetical protein
LSSKDSTSVSANLFFSSKKSHPFDEPFAKTRAKREPRISRWNRVRFRLAAETQLHR